MMLNSAVAESLKIYADRLEGAEDFETALHEMIKKTIKDHKRILFNGNGYDESWVKEATEVRGLSNYPTTPDCMPHLLDEKNVKMLTSHKVFTEAELRSRVDIMLDNYSKQVLIEANTMLEMSRKLILPAIECYETKLSGAVAAKKAVSPSVACVYENDVIGKLSDLADKVYTGANELEKVIGEAGAASDIIAESVSIKDNVIPVMNDIRAAADEAESFVSK
jgi:glutamine synthetase